MRAEEGRRAGNLKHRGATKEEGGEMDKTGDVRANAKRQLRQGVLASDLL